MSIDNAQGTEDRPEAVGVPGAQGAGPRPVTAGEHPERVKAVGLALVLTAALSLVLALFVAVAVNSGPSGVRIAVAGPPPVVEQIQSRLAAAGGENAFEVTGVADQAAAEVALREREAEGAIVMGPTGPTVLTASAASPAIAQLLTAAAGELSGAAPAAQVVDVVPLPVDDARGAGFAAGAFPMIIAGIALGAAAALALRRRGVVLGAVLGGAVAIGVSFAGILAWFGVSGGHYWAEAAAIALTVGACAVLVAGLARMLGLAGIGLGALLILLVGNPLSGIATSPRFLPAPWGEVGQWLPTGAGGTLLRSVSYFPQASVWAPLLVLLGWATIGVVMVMIGRKVPAAHAPAAAPAAPPAG